MASRSGLVFASVSVFASQTVVVAAAGSTSVSVSLFSRLPTALCWKMQFECCGRKHTRQLCVLPSVRACWHSCAAWALGEPCVALEPVPWSPPPPLCPPPSPALSSVLNMVKLQHSSSPHWAVPISTGLSLVAAQNWLAHCFAQPPETLHSMFLSGAHMSIFCTPP